LIPGNKLSGKNITKLKGGRIMKDVVKRFISEESGQGMTEYALILALVSIVAMAALGIMGGSIREKFEAITGKLNE
jgi:pilus assembly protein Flp/PilA